MSRLIDADALLLAVEVPIVGNGEFYSGMDSEQERCANLIKDAPTVDPVKHEYWIGYDTTAYTGTDGSGEPICSPRRFYRCSGCRYGTVVKSDYCPGCGARMDADKLGASPDANS